MSPALHLKPNNSSPPLEVWLQLSPCSPGRIFIIPPLGGRIQQPLRRVLVAKCQGLSPPPPVVFTSSSLLSVSVRP